MYIILRQAPSEIDKILNIFYSSDITPIRNWVKEYINEEIESYKLAPNSSNIKNVFYELNDGEFCFQLLKRYKKINKGYVYNSSEKMTDIIYSISILEFDSNHCKHLETSEMWKNVNQEVNNRVLKQLDKDTLLQIIKKLEQRISTKNIWNKTEFVGLLTETLRSSRKDLYSSIAKRLKRFGQRKSFYKKQTHTIINIPDDFNSSISTCKLEAIKHEKKDQ